MKYTCGCGHRDETGDETRGCRVVWMSDYFCLRMRDSTRTLQQLVDLTEKQLLLSRSYCLNFPARVLLFFVLFLNYPHLSEETWHIGCRNMSCGVSLISLDKGWERSTWTQSLLIIWLWNHEEGKKLGFLPGRSFKGPTQCYQDMSDW